MLFLYGVLFGFSGVIPGVSGGTMLMAFGAHEKVRNALCRVFRRPNDTETSEAQAYQADSEYQDEPDSPENRPKTAVITLLIGMMIGIAAYTFALSALFEQYATACYLFFTGFIVGSVPLAFRAATKYDQRMDAKGRPVPLFKRVTAGRVVLFLIAAAATVFIGMMDQGVTQDYTITPTPSPDDPSVTVVTLTNHTTSDISDWRITFPEGAVSAVGNAKLIRAESLPEMVTGWFNPQAKSDRTNAFVSDDGEAIKPGAAVIFTYKSRMAENMKMEPHITYAMNFGLFFRLMFGVFAAAFAVIMPGISGSHVMMLTGIYATVMSGLQRADVPVLLPVIIGAALGLYAGASAIKRLIERYEAATYSIILGLYVGSIYIVFPKDINVGAELFVGIGLGVFGAALAVTLGAEKKAAWELKDNGKNR